MQPCFVFIFSFSLHISGRTRPLLGVSVC
jgi:hypothetical protein